MERFEVTVQLKPEVLDPEGRAIQSTLERLGHAEVKEVIVSKRFVIGVAGEPSDAAAKVESIAKDFLANPVSQSYSVRKL